MLSMAGSALKIAFRFPVCSGPTLSPTSKAPVSRASAKAAPIRPPERGPGTPAAVQCAPRNVPAVSFEEEGGAQHDVAPERIGQRLRRAQAVDAVMDRQPAEMTLRLSGADAVSLAFL